MPVKNSIKQYVCGGIYHAYNRGINKDVIFHGHSDYKKFMAILEESLLSRSELLSNYEKLAKKNRAYRYKVKQLEQTENFHGKIRLIAFCIMPNHYHLLLKQRFGRDIISFFRAVQGRYAAYYNNKYQRVGPLFQSRYKAALVRDDAYLQTVFDYIHNNPSSLPRFSERSSEKVFSGKIPAIAPIEKYKWSSLAHYKGFKKYPWIRPI